MRRETPGQGNRMNAPGEIMKFLTSTGKVLGLATSGPLNGPETT